MKISSSFKNTDSRSAAKSFKGVPTNPHYIPEIIGKMGKVAGKYIDSPEQRLILAISTLMFKPAIDLKYADDDKKIDTALKSTAKALAGGFTGVTIRALFIKLTDKYIGYDFLKEGMVSKVNKLNYLFLPKVFDELKDEAPEKAKLLIKKYSNTLGSLFAVAFMILFSNAKIDVPLTNDIQDVLSGVVKSGKSWTKSIGDVVTARNDNIKNWFISGKNKIKNIIKKLNTIAQVVNADETGKKKESKL